MAMKAKLHIETELKNGKSILKTSFCTPPFKIADVTEDKKQEGLQLMMMSSSPGVLDGDEYDLKINIAEKCKLELRTQAYQRLHQMKEGARQTTCVNLEKNSSLIYIPHPLVPHEDSVFVSSNKISMEESSSLIWGEVMSCGRKLNGEIFKFSSYHNITEVFLKGRLVVKENILMKPAEINMHSIGQWEGFTHQASLICIDSSANVEGKANSIVEFLQEEKNIEYGVSSLAVNGLVVRILGRKSEQLFEVLKSISVMFLQKRLKENIHVA